MIGKKVEAAVNEQIRKEFYSSYLYLAMSAHFERNNLPGVAHWLEVQSKEEQDHAMKLLKHLQERSGTADFQAIDAPPSKWKTPLEAFEKVLEHERMITASVHNLYELAGKEKDYAAQVLLHWFVTEQVEEEKNVEDILAQLRMIDAHGTAVLMLDHQLAKRGKE